MKKFLMFALVAMIAGMASAQTLTWIGNSAVYVLDEDTWYNGGATWGAGGAFDTHDFGTLSSWSLTLGGQAQTYVDDNGSHPTMTVTMGYGVDATYWDGVTLNWLSYGSNNDTWENMVGEDIVAAAGTGVGTHTIDIYYSATDGSTTVYDNNGGGNYHATYTQAIPEPATMSLLGLGALAMVLRRKMSK